MTDGDDFQESVPDGIANAIMELSPEAECTGQDAYEILTDVFGARVDGERFKAFTEAECSKMAAAVGQLVEDGSSVSVQDGRRIIEMALTQWGG